MPRTGTLLMLLLLAGSVGGTAWWLARPKPDSGPPGPPLTALDVVCSGRVDGLHPVASLSPLVPGRVAKVLVSEGDVVAAGQPLVALDESAAKLRVEEARAAAEAAAVEVEAAEAEAKLFPLRVEGQTAAAAAAGERVAAAKRLLDQRRTQQSFNQITAADVAATESEVRQLEQLELAERKRLEELKAANTGLRARAARAKEAAAGVGLKQASQAVADCTLAAPTAGVVLRIQVAEGESFAPNAVRPAVVFRPAGPLVVRAELEQEFLGRVRAGMTATIRDESRVDSPVWTGTVRRVGDWVATRRSVVLEPGELNDVRTAECLVDLDPPADGLLVGQRVRVRIARGK